MSRLAIVYYSSTGGTHRLALAAQEGALEAGAEVRLLRAAELAPDAAIDGNPAWRAHLDDVGHIPIATPDDLEWADGFLFGTPTRFGLALGTLITLVLIPALYFIAFRKKEDDVQRSTTPAVATGEPA